MGIGTDPVLRDTDGDGATDGAEDTLGTDPTVWDTDGDGIADGAEIALGSDPLDPMDVPLISGGANASCAAGTGGSAWSAALLMLTGILVRSMLRARTRGIART